MADVLADEDGDEDRGDERIEPEFWAEHACPWCGEPAVLALDPFGGTDQEYVQDCEVCCRPWRVQVSYTHSGAVRVDLTPAD